MLLSEPSANPTFCNWQITDTTDRSLIQQTDHWRNTQITNHRSNDTHNREKVWSLPVTTEIQEMKVRKCCWRMVPIGLFSAAFATDLQFTETNSVSEKHNKMSQACVSEKALMCNILDKYKALMLKSSLHTKMIPVFLQILNLQLVLALSENWFGVFLKAPWQDATLPVPNINSSIGIYNSWEGKMTRG